MSDTPLIIHDIQEVYQKVRAAQQQGKRVGLVPTMGALHEGHLSLVERSNRDCDLTVVTIFVNPTQFAPDEDFDKYPRTLNSDVELLGKYSPVWVLSPEVDSIYPSGSSTEVKPPDVAIPLEGEKRPDHFAGVATIVLKLFNIVPADAAYFGQKDYQQAQVIKHMVDDLNVPVQVEVCPIVREKDGLAMSSRNRYMSLEERKIALSLSQVLKEAEAAIQGGATDSEKIIASGVKLLTDVGVTSIDYVAIVDPETLEPVQTISGSVVILIAAYVGGTRLIDNQIVSL